MNQLTEIYNDKKDELNINNSQILINISYILCCICLSSYRLDICVICLYYHETFHDSSVNIEGY